MSKKILYGDEFVFTSRNSTGTITLSAGANETLSITGAAEATSLTNTSTPSQLAYKDLTGPTNLQATNTTVAHNQGTSVSVGKSGSDYWLAFGCPNAILNASLGGISIWKSTAGAAFAENTLLVSESATPNASTGIYCHMNDTADVVCFTDDGAVQPQGYVYRRTTNTWALEDTLFGGRRIRSNGLYLIQAGFGCLVEIYLNTAGIWTLQQDLTRQTGFGGVLQVSLVDIYAATCAVVDALDNYVSVYTRSGTTWTHTDSLFAPTTIITLDMYGNTIVYCTATEVYIATRADNSSSYALEKVFALTGTIKESSISTGEIISIVSGTTNSIYSKQSTRNWVLIDALTISGAVSVALADVFCLLGSPTTNTFGTVKTYGVIPIVDTTAVTDVSLVTTPMGLFSSLYPVTFSTEVQVTGDVKVTGKFNGNLKNTTNVVSNSLLSQNITNNTDTTVLNWVFSTLPLWSGSSFFNKTTGTFTVVESGMYLIVANGIVEANATGDRKLTLLVGSTVIGTSSTKSATIATGMSLSVVYNLTVSEVVSCKIFQNSGSTLTFSSGLMSLTKLSTL